MSGRSTRASVRSNVSHGKHLPAAEPTLRDVLNILHDVLDRVRALEVAGTMRGLSATGRARHRQFAALLPALYDVFGDLEFTAHEAVRVARMLPAVTLSATCPEKSIGKLLSAAAKHGPVLGIVIESTRKEGNALLWQTRRVSGVLGASKRQ